MRGAEQVRGVNRRDVFESARGPFYNFLHINRFTQLLCVVRMILFTASGYWPIVAL
jgi:hypothetical protein